jgi:hypothetical protein
MTSYVVVSALIFALVARSSGSEIVLEFADGVLGQGSKSHEAARVHCPSH